MTHVQMQGMLICVPGLNVFINYRMYPYYEPLAWQNILNFTSFVCSIIPNIKTKIISNIMCEIKNECWDVSISFFHWACENFYSTLEGTIPAATHIGGTCRPIPPGFAAHGFNKKNQSGELVIPFLFRDILVRWREM